MYVQARRRSMKQLLRRPAGLADGLALKEPAPPQPAWISPNYLGPPPSAQAEVRRLPIYSRGSLEETSDGCTRPQVPIGSTSPNPCRDAGSWTHVRDRTSCHGLIPRTFRPP